jgi:Na+/phosphate symporter
MFTNEELHARIRLLEAHVKRLEEDSAWIQKDIGHLIDIIENLKPEIHTHYTNITENITCMECDEQGFEG